MRDKSSRRACVEVAIHGGVGAGVLFSLSPRGFFGRRRFWNHTFTWWSVNPIEFPTDTISSCEGNLLAWNEASSAARTPSGNFFFGVFSSPALALEVALGLRWDAGVGAARHIVS